MQSNATSVSAYFKELPEDRRKALTKLRSLIREIAPSVQESMAYGMPTYSLGDMLFALASQKGHMALYLCDTDVVDAHRSGLGKLNCGKSCIRFRSLEQLPMDVISAILREAYERRRTAMAESSQNDATSQVRGLVCGLGDY